MIDQSKLIIKIFDFFNKPNAHNVPDNAKTFYYVSAGNDFRANVFLTDFNINRLNENLIKPELYVYSCIGPETDKLLEKLLKGECIVYDDTKTSIEVTHFEILSFVDEIKSNLVINEDFVRYKPKNPIDAFYFEIVVKGSQLNKKTQSIDSYSETQKILYIQHENIDAFQKVILQSNLEIVYLSALREGCGFGGCKKSIIDFIYKDNSPGLFTDKSFKPKYTLLFTDFTQDVFETKVSQSEFAKFYDKDFIQFIPESTDRRNERDSCFYKMQYEPIKPF